MSTTHEDRQPESNGFPAAIALVHLFLLSGLAIFVLANYDFIIFGAAFVAAESSSSAGKLFRDAHILPFVPAVGAVVGWMRFAWRRKTWSDAFQTIVYSLGVIVILLFIL